MTDQTVVPIIQWHELTAADQELIARRAFGPPTKMPSGRVLTREQWLMLGGLVRVEPVGTDDFWATITRQLAEARAARSAADVIRIFNPADNPYHDTDITTGGPGFFAGSGGDGRLDDALADAGWVKVWAKAIYHWRMRAPDGSTITYVEGDLYPEAAS